MELEQKIEGLLFYKGEPMQKTAIADLLSVSLEEVEQALIKLEENLTGRGVTLIKKDNSIMMAVTSEMAPIIESIRKDEITKELSKAALETLSIILYKNGVTRNEIDYIRGVNSSFIIRNLLVRGLVEKDQDKNDSRRSFYKPTFDTLSYMGVTRIEELPDYEKVVGELNNTIKQSEANNE